MDLNEFQVSEWLAFVNMAEDDVDICAQIVDDDGNDYNKVMIPHHSEAWKYVQEVYVDTIKVEQNKLILCITLPLEDESLINPNLTEAAPAKKADPVFKWRFVFDNDPENGDGLDFDVFEGKGTLHKFLQKLSEYFLAPRPDIIEDDKGKKWNLDNATEYTQILATYPIEKVVDFILASELVDDLYSGNILYADVNGKEPEGLYVDNYYDYVDMSSGDAEELEHEVDSAYEMGFFEDEDDEEDDE